MSSTNKTTNYELSQFIGSDKPTFLGDYNGDMLKIDTQMKANATAIQTASAGIETATTNASTALTKANEAISDAETAQTTGTNALTKATANETNLNNFIAYLNLVNFDTISSSSINRASGSATIDSSSSLTVASNSTRDVAKIYGRIVISNITANGELQFQTNLRPAENININGVCIRAFDGSARNFVTMTISTTGLVTIPFTTASSTSSSCYFLFTACLLFLKNFGDTVVDD